MQDYDIYDIEGADLMCHGCAAHSDPECLCDVDLSRGRCGAADTSQMRHWHGTPMEYMEWRLRDAERRWMVDTFAPGLLDQLEFWWSGRAEHDNPLATLTYKGEIIESFVLAAFTDARRDGRRSHRIAQETGMLATAAEDFHSVLYQIKGTLWDVLRGYALYLWKRAPEGVSKAVIGREVRKFAPTVKDYTIYRWMYDDEHGPRSHRKAQQEAA